MRNCSTLDPNVEALLRNHMRERGIALKEVVDQALRSALTGDSARI